MFLVDLTGFVIGLILLLLLVVCVTIFVVAMWKEYHNEFFSVKDLVDDTSRVLGKAAKGFFGLFHKKGSAKAKKRRDLPAPKPDHRKEFSSDNKMANIYGPKAFMSEQEAIRLRKLRKWANAKGYQIFYRVRLAELMSSKVDPNVSKKPQMILMTRCADFVVCDENYTVKCVIQMNDPAGKKTEANRFVQDALTACGYRVLLMDKLSIRELERI